MDPQCPEPESVEESALGDAAAVVDRPALEHVYPSMHKRSNGDSYVWVVNSFAELSLHNGLSSVEIGVQKGYRVPARNGRPRSFVSDVVLVMAEPDIATPAPGFLQKKKGSKLFRHSERVKARAYRRGENLRSAVCVRRPAFRTVSGRISRRTLFREQLDILAGIP